MGLPKKVAETVSDKSLNSLYKIYMKSSYLCKPNVLFFALENVTMSENGNQVGFSKSPLNCHGRKRSLLLSNVPRFLEHVGSYKAHNEAKY